MVIIGYTNGISNTNPIVILMQLWHIQIILMTFLHNKIKKDAILSCFNKYCGLNPIG